MQQKPFDKIIDSMEKTIDKINKIPEESENTDAESGENKKENEQRPEYDLYKAILASSIEMLKLPETEQVFNNLKDLIGDKTESLIDLFILSMTHSAYNAIVYYDSLLKEELSNQLDNIGKYINNLNADVTAMKSVIKVHSKKIDDIKSSIEIEEFKKNINI